MSGWRMRRIFLRGRVSSRWRCSGSRGWRRRLRSGSRGRNCQDSGSRICRTALGWVGQPVVCDRLAGLWGGRSVVGGYCHRRSLRSARGVSLWRGWNLAGDVRARVCGGCSCVGEWLRSTIFSSRHLFRRPGRGNAVGSWRCQFGRKICRGIAIFGITISLIS